MRHGGLEEGMKREKANAKYKKENEWKVLVCV